jgi:hypothetical protein
MKEWSATIIFSAEQEFLWPAYDATVTFALVWILKTGRIWCRETSEKITLWMCGIKAFVFFDVIGQVIAPSVLTVQNDSFAEGIQPIHGITRKKNRCFVIEIIRFDIFHMSAMTS